MKQPVKRRKHYEATREGQIYVYPSLEVPGRTRVFDEVASLLQDGAHNLIALFRRKERFGSLKQEKR